MADLNRINPELTDRLAADMETTGLDADHDTIIEIACIRIREGRITDEKRVELLAPKAAWLKRTKEKLLKVQDEKDKIREVATQQKTLFSGGGKMENLKRNKTKESLRTQILSLRDKVYDKYKNDVNSELKQDLFMSMIDSLADAASAINYFEIIK